ncbi:MAG: MFS transporter [Bacteroidales bacterium]|nr:MFS transporter [Bacteroidales bacterium]MDT8373426.1 MFS transporter [Bacteroidales bacterium]
MNVIYRRKPRLSFWQIWNMSFGFLGIQFGFALQNGNVSRIFQTLGADIDNIPILWIAAPVTGLLVQPIIGHMSDRTWNRLGRRRPYFLTGAVFASLALAIITNSPTWIFATVMLWIMDASINISMEPFRAFVGDMLSSKQRTTGFAMQSFFIGIGAVVGSFLPWMLANWFNVPEVPAEGKLIPFNLKLSFYIGAVVLLVAVLWTIFRTKEYSPAELEEFEKGEIVARGEIMEEHGAQSSGYGAEDAQEADRRSPSKAGEYQPSPPSGGYGLQSRAQGDVNFYRPGIIWLAVGIILTFILSRVNLEKELYVVTGGVAIFGLLQILAGLLKSGGRGGGGLNSILTDLRHMPATMGQLAVVQFFTWFALFSLWIYTTAAVTSQVYGTTDTVSLEYNRGANWVGVLFGVYNGFAAVVAFMLPVLAKYTSRKITHSICLVIGGISLVSISMIHTPGMLILPMLGIGLAWASILSMPYAILTGSLPHNKMGIYMGIFNFFIVIPQILAASILGSMVKHLFHGNTMLALVTGGISMVIAALSVYFVRDVDDRR